MFELLAVPCWQAPERTLDDWVAQLTALGGPVVVTRESSGVAWLELNGLRLRGYVVLENGKIEAINFELAAPDTEPAARVVAAAAAALGWEVHDEQEGDDDDE